MTSPQVQGFIDRIDAAARSSRDLSGTADWICQNTRHPRDITLPWSFKDHEFQKAILNDGNPRVVCRKASQVGLSEIVVRLQLALLAIFPSTTAIYTLPTTSFARQFTRSRIDPVIESSPLLSSLIPRNNDSSELKQFGTSFLYIRGSYGQGAAISIPADILINDEVDFSNQQALTTFASRLGHASLGDGHGIRREFSTPTVDGFGISKSFDESTQNYYAVCCDSCQQWVVPDFFEDTIIPGWDDPVIEFDRSDLTAGKYNIAEAYLCCPNKQCRQKLTIQNLSDPEKRKWIAKCPDKSISGYQVSPFDVPTINPVSKTLSYIGDYDRKADWVNFKVGLPFEDAQTSFLLERIQYYQAMSPLNQWKVPPPSQHSSQQMSCVMGVDVGKTSWVVIGTQADTLNVIYAERIRQDGSDHLNTRLQQLIDYFDVAIAIVDAAPDFTTALQLVEYNHVGRVYGCYYVRQLTDKLSDLEANDEKGTIKAIRTHNFDRLVAQINGGEIRLPRHSEVDIIISHLGNLKRVSTSEEAAHWHATGDDHYGHALNYMGMADKLLGNSRARKNSVVPTLPMLSSTKIGADSEPGHPNPEGHDSNVHPLLRK